jgi:predicted nucleic-acid-binding Zn-ribbon protein|tara:strand:+ start:137 stop:373 length:237 start_codon:yes stop_codon:yes gene_type:complete
MSDGKCVKCGSSRLNESVNARIRGGLQMISCKDCGFVEFYTPSDKEKSNNLKDGLKHTALILIIGIGFILVMAVLSSL